VNFRGITIVLCSIVAGAGFWATAGLLAAEVNGNVTAPEAKDDRSALPAVGQLPSAPAAAYDALAGTRRVTLQVRDMAGRPVRRAKVRGYSEDWRLLWPLKADAETDAAGQVVAALPRGRWCFFVSSQPGAPSSAARPAVCIVSPTCLVDKDQTIVVRPDAEVNLSVTVDGQPLRKLERLLLGESRYGGQIGACLDLAGLSLPAVIQMSRENTFQGVFVAAGEGGSRLVGEFDAMKSGRLPLAYKAADLSVLDVRQDGSVFDLKGVEVEFQRGFALNERVGPAHPLWLPVAAGERILVQPGLVRIGYRLDTADGQQLEFLPKAQTLAAGQTVVIRPGSALTARAFHVSNRPYMPKNVISLAAAFMDADGYLAERWAQLKPPGKGRSPVSFAILQGQRQIAEGTLPPALRMWAAEGVADVNLDELNYAFSFAGRGGKVTLQCRGGGQVPVTAGRVTVHAPEYLADNARVMATAIDEVIPRYDEIVTVRPRNPERRWNINIWPTMRAGAMGGGATRENMWFQLPELYNMTDRRSHCGILVVELPHCYQFYHTDNNQWFMWQPLKAEVRRLAEGSLAVADRSWGVPGLLDGGGYGQSWPNKGNIPGFVLYWQYGFAPFREFIRRHDVYQVWLPSVGFSEGDALCAAYSQCVNQDLTSLFQAFGRDVDRQRVALARRMLAIAPDPVVEPGEGYFGCPIRLVDGDVAGKAAFAYPPANKARPARFGVTFASPQRIARVVAHLSSEAGGEGSGADRYCIETFDGTVWTEVPGTNNRGSAVQRVDEKIEPREVRGIAVRVLEPSACFVQGRRMYFPVCSELEVFDDQGRSVTRPVISPSSGAAGKPPAAKGPISLQESPQEPEERRQE
jgi:hypothetical protein